MIRHLSAHYNAPMTSFITERSISAACCPGILTSSTKVAVLWLASHLSVSRLHTRLMLSSYPHLKSGVRSLIMAYILFEGGNQRLIIGDWWVIYYYAGSRIVHDAVGRKSKARSQSLALISHF